ncbi:MAG TPA: hypothetical protein VIL92_03520 [Gaiellaceae bacterium]
MRFTERLKRGEVPIALEREALNDRSERRGVGVFVVEQPSEQRGVLEGLRDVLRAVVNVWRGVGIVTQIRPNQKA